MRSNWAGLGWPAPKTVDTCMSEKLVVNFGLIAWIPTNSNEIIWQDIFPSLLSFLFPMNQILSPSNFFSFLLCSQLEVENAFDFLHLDSLIYSFLFGIYAHSSILSVFILSCAFSFCSDCTAFYFGGFVEFLLAEVSVSCVESLLEFCNVEVHFGLCLLFHLFIC